MKPETDEIYKDGWIHIKMEEPYFAGSNYKASKYTHHELFKVGEIVGISSGLKKDRAGGEFPIMIIRTSTGKEIVVTQEVGEKLLVQLAFLHPTIVISLS